MDPRTVRLRDGRDLLIRQADASDAARLIKHVEGMCTDSEFTTWMPGEFSLTEEQEAELMERYRADETKVFMVAMMDDAIAGTLSFSAGNRERLRHRGEFGVGVRRHAWGNGIGGHLMDTLIAWAQDGGIINKINLRVREDNARAVELYRRKGFVLEGTVSREIAVDGEFFAVHCMGLEL